MTHADAPAWPWENCWHNYGGRILDDKVRFVGDEVAAVAAESVEIAEAALELTPVPDANHAIEVLFLEMSADAATRVRAHFGAIAIQDGDDAQKERARIFGQRIAEKALELFER